MVRQQINELHQLMKQAREMPLLKVGLLHRNPKLDHLKVTFQVLLLSYSRNTYSTLLLLQAEIVAEKKKVITPKRKVCGVKIVDVFLYVKHSHDK